MAQTEAQLKARLLKLADELAVLAKRGQEIRQEMQAILAKMPIDAPRKKPSPLRAKGSGLKLRGKSAKTQ